MPPWSTSRAVTGAAAEPDARSPRRPRPGRHPRHAPRQPRTHAQRRQHAAGARTARGLGWERAGIVRCDRADRQTQAVVPRARLRQPFPRLDDVVGRVLPADSSPLQLFNAFLETLADRGPALDEVSRTAAGDAAIELARVALGAGLPSEPRTMRDAIVMQVRYIEVHLPEPGPTPPASLRRTRSPFGRCTKRSSSPANPSALWFAAADLERCHADLVTPSDDTVSDIARRWGFRDSSYFSRAFRRHYGVAPRELKSAHGQAAVAR